MPPILTPSRPRVADLPQPIGSAADPDAARLAALRLLGESPHLSQRELARALGLSLGKTHYVLHALLEKGLVKARNFRRSGRKLAYAYVLTPRGLTEKLQLTRSFLARKEAEYETLRMTIDSLRFELDRTGERTRSNLL
jgi:EPS-associated MarR family transcriptional regulator